MRSELMKKTSNWESTLLYDNFWHLSVGKNAKNFFEKGIELLVTHFWQQQQQHFMRVFWSSYTVWVGFALIKGRFSFCGVKDAYWNFITIHWNALTQHEQLQCWNKLKTKTKLETLMWDEKIIIFSDTNGSQLQKISIIVMNEVSNFTLWCSVIK